MSNPVTVLDLLKGAVTNKASDLHLSAGLPAMYRIDGELQLVDSRIFEHQEVLDLIYAVMTEQQRLEYKTRLDLDFSVQYPDLARFRVTVYHQERGVGVVFRVIPTTILSLMALNVPSVVTKLASFCQGLILVTGPTGSGKSTTLAAIIDHINTTRSQHIVTIEDPIEFVHRSKQCLVTQREVFRDTQSFSAALRSVLRQDPDVILVGELRDLDTIRLAITAAETGHLVLATLHTSSASQTINRLIDVFPGDEQAMIRSMLSGSLQAVVAQRLLKKNKGGRIAAFEIMVCNAAIRNLIREDKVAQMYSVLQTGKSFGMQTLDQHLLELVQANQVMPETARELAVFKELF